MGRRGRRVLSLVCALLILLTSVGLDGTSALFAAPGQAEAVKYSQFVEVNAADLGGQVLYPDARTPVAEVPVRVWSVAETKFVYQGMTDTKGNYTLPELKPGRYILIVGDRVSVDVRVSDKVAATKQALNVIVPRGRAFFAPRDMTVELVQGSQGTTNQNEELLKTLLIVGASSATAVAIVALGGGFEEHSHRHYRRLIQSP